MGKWAQFVLCEKKKSKDRKTGRKKEKWEIKNCKVFRFFKFKISLSSTLF